VLPVECRVVLIGLFFSCFVYILGGFPGFLVNIVISCCCLVACSRYIFYSVDGSLVLCYDVAWYPCYQ
jgi:hypothetical protein